MLETGCFCSKWTVMICFLLADMKKFHHPDFFVLMFIVLCFFLPFCYNSWFFAYKVTIITVVISPFQTFLNAFLFLSISPVNGMKSRPWPEWVRAASGATGIEIPVLDTVWYLFWLFDKENQIFSSTFAHLLYWWYILESLEPDRQSQYIKVLKTLQASIFYLLLKMEKSAQRLQHCYRFIFSQTK